MMGVGKSTVGKRLAKKLKLKFIDIDQLIEHEEKNTIKIIFKKKGENYFRKIEKRITLEVLKKNDLVVALGGGGFMDTSIRKEIDHSCVSFWLDLNLNSLLLRLKNVKKRPLLDTNDLKKIIKKIYSDRKKIYSKSDHRIKCDTINIEQIVIQIIKLYENT